ncbi:MAG: hypothetical protein F4X26_08205 [Chloroflexi bacterium]|nr:hypothetical protein [Chloroflexota bacterium]
MVVDDEGSPVVDAVVTVVTTADTPGVHTLRTDDRARAEASYFASSTEGVLVFTTIVDSHTTAATDLSVQDPASVSSLSIDAPDSVEPLSETLITMTATNKTGELLSGVPITVQELNEGVIYEGLTVEGVGPVDDLRGRLLQRAQLRRDGAVDVEGRAKFTFLAPRNAGWTALLFRTGTDDGHQVRLQQILNITTDL